MKYTLLVVLCLKSTLMSSGIPKTRWLMVKKWSRLPSLSMISVLGQLEMNCLDVDCSDALNDNEEWEFS